MRILMDYRPALRERSGVGEYVHELAAALVPQLAPADTLTLFSSSRKDRLPADRVPGTRVVDARIPVRVLNFTWHRLGWPPVERFAGPVDVVHAPHPLLIPSSGAAQLVTIHDLDFLDHPERTRREIRRDYAALAAAHARRAHGVICVSAFTASETERRLGVPRERITVCPNGAPPWTPRPAPRPNGPILFIGTLEPRKNVGVLLRAYAILVREMPSAPSLILAGRSTPDAAPWLRMLDEAPLAGRVQHLGYVTDARKRELYAAASMLVLPSHLEGFGLPVLEAMTAGVPVVASRRGALPEVGGDAAAYIEPDDESGLAAAMRKYLEDPAAAAGAALRGVRRARDFSWTGSAATLYDAYRAAAHRRLTGANR